MIEPITAPITAVLCLLVPVLIGALYYENKRRKRVARRNSELSISNNELINISRELLSINRDLQYRLKREQQRNFALSSKSSEAEKNRTKETLAKSVRKIVIR